MRDLHKIYEPPIPKHQIPTNNPFYNKQMVSSEYMKSKVKASPRSLQTWMSSPNTKRVQKKMANRITYLKMIASNKNALMSDLVHVEKNHHRNQSEQGADISMDMQTKMN